MFELFVRGAAEAYGATELQHLLKAVALPGGARVALTTGQPVIGSYDLIIVSTTEATIFDQGVILTEVAPRQVGALRLMRCATLTGEGQPILLADAGVVGLALPPQPGRPLMIRLGFNLPAEVGEALAGGLTPEAGQEPLVDHLVQLVVRLIDRAGKPWARVPPRPWGHPYLLVLSHDIDHTSVREHWFDRTLLGIIYRSGPLSLLQWLTGKRRFSSLLSNWWFLLKLPLMLLGWVKDGWAVIADYAALEEAHGATSTFFFIPVADRPGKGLAGGSAPSTRAARYELEPLRPFFAELRGKGFEVGLHGLDAWVSVAEAATEVERVAEVLGQPVAGVRMHWLYLGEGSLQAFDAAGLDYDATWGYNTHAGYRAGTAQVYQPPGCRHLLEVPLHIQDGALLSEQHQHLPERQAQERVDTMLAHVRAGGGLLSLLWHDCAMVPPRGWAGLYKYLLAQGQADGAWLTGCGAAAAWFRARRDLAVRLGPAGEVLTSPLPSAERPFTLQIRYPAGAETTVREFCLAASNRIILDVGDENGDAIAD